MLPPDSTFKKYWNALIVALVMYNTLFIILVVCYNRYEQSTGLYWYMPSRDEVNATPMVIDYLVEEFQKDQGIDLRNDPMAVQRLREAAEVNQFALSWEDMKIISGLAWLVESAQHNIEFVSDKSHPRSC